MEREARRKKIASRETDRIALITGRIHNLYPNYPKSSSFSNPRRDHLPAAQHARSSSEPVVVENDKAFLQQYPHGGDYHDNDEDVTNREKPEFQNGAQSALITTSVSNSSKDPKFPEKPFEYHLSSISAREIHFSIISSERTRVLCSFVIAVLVVLSHVNLPHKLITSKSLIAYRPLYAVLLTDVLIVSARLALYSQGKEEDKEVKSEEDIQNWDDAVKLLEFGLMMHQGLRAVFIDCSLYLAIVICGLSLV